MLPTVLCVIVALFVVDVVLHRASHLRTLVLSAAVAMALMLPWALRNRFALDEFVWFRSNFGMEFRLSYNDLAWPDIDRNSSGGAFNLYHPLASVDAAQRVRTEGEVRYNKRLQREAVTWIAANPSRSLQLLCQRVVFFWFPRTLKPLQSAFLSVLSGLSLAGLRLMFKHHRTAAVLLAATWVSFPLVYYVVYSAIRYRYPMIWTLLLASTYFFFDRRYHRNESTAEGK